METQDGALDNATSLGWALDSWQSTRPNAPKRTQARHPVGMATYRGLEARGNIATRNLEASADKVPGCTFATGIVPRFQALSDLGHIGPRVRATHE